MPWRSLRALPWCWEVLAAANKAEAAAARAEDVAEKCCAQVTYGKGKRAKKGKKTE